MDNDEDSDNNLHFRAKQSATIRQTSNVNIRNNASVNANTGRNEVSDNGRGDVKIETGDAMSLVEVKNIVAGNTIQF